MATGRTARSCGRHLEIPGELQPVIPTVLLEHVLHVPCIVQVLQASDPELRPSPDPLEWRRVLLREQGREWRERQGAGNCGCQAGPPAGCRSALDALAPQHLECRSFWTSCPDGRLRGHFGA